MLRFALIPVLLLSLLPEAFAARSKGFRPAKTCEEYFSDSAIRDANYVDYEDDAGLVTEDVALTPEAVLEAYSKGVFPWIDYGKTAGWYVLKNRGVIDFSELHISASLRREIRKSPFEVTFDRAFEDVIRGCAKAKRPEDDGTWISKKFIATYTKLHEMGYAHSAEVWLDGKLVGGLYGVHVNGVFSAESMFYKVSGASKIALLRMIDHLRSRGIEWMDTQQVSSFPRQIGAKEIPMQEFVERLGKAKKKAISFYP